MRKKLKDLMAQMTVEEKIGQLMQFHGVVFGESESVITGPLSHLGVPESYLKNVGTVLNFKNAEEMRRIQERHLAADRNRIPLIFMMDVIHGYRTIFPIPLAMGSSFDPELLAECSRMASKEASAGGVQVTFTPMVDYARDARWGRVMETCGEDPMLNGVMGAAQVKAFQGDDISDPDHIAACVKHFAAYGGAEAGRDYNTVELSERVLREYYLPAYKACVDAGVKMLMPSFNSLSGVPSVANRWLIGEVLKKEWKFKGTIISDYNAVGELIKHGVAADRKEAAYLAFSNSCDIEMMSSTYYQYLKELIDEGRITTEQLDESVARVLELKDELGLFKDPYHGASPEKEKAVCLTAENRALVRIAAEQSAVLLKNNGVLPFSPKTVKKIALIGPYADTGEINGPWSCHGNPNDTVTILAGLRNLLPDAEITVSAGCGNLWDDTGTSGFRAAVKAAKNADAVILCLGEPVKYSGEGNSRVNIDLPGMQTELARKVTEANPNTAVLLFNGRPLALTELDAFAPAIMEMWFPGTEGGNAAARLLFGKANPCGKLTMSFPRAVGQCPLYYNHPNTGRPKTKPADVHQPFASSYIGADVSPLYCFGHGLSYTKFTYEKLELDRAEMTKNDAITVRVTVKNSGRRAGKEVVQLYLRDVVGSTVRPIQSLAAFEKVELKAGEEKVVTFRITEPMLRFVGFDCKWISEPGEFKVSVGYADHLLLTQSFTLR